MNYRDFGPLEEYWNHLDQWDATTKIIHYTRVGSQPWKAPGHKHAAVFMRELKQALDDQVLQLKDIEKEIAAGHIYAGFSRIWKNLALVVNLYTGYDGWHESFSMSARQSSEWSRV